MKCGFDRCWEERYTVIREPVLETFYLTERGRRKWPFSWDLVPSEEGRDQWSRPRAQWSSSAVPGEEPADPTTPKISEEGVGWIGSFLFLSFIEPPLKNMGKQDSAALKITTKDSKNHCPGPSTWPDKFYNPCHMWYVMWHIPFITFSSRQIVTECLTVCRNLSVQLSNTQPLNLTKNTLIADDKGKTYVVILGQWFSNFFL